jgi:hypothetical protein
VIIFFTVHAIFTSGLLLPLDVQVSSFPGGEFVYKTTGRDYAASMSLLHTVAQDLKIKEKEYEDIMYNLYLDDPLKVSGRKQRFASGILLKNREEESKDQERKRILLEKNYQKTDLTPQEIVELPAFELWERLKYHTQELPEVKAAVVQFPFTNGFVSALVHSYKVSFYIMNIFRQYTIYIRKSCYYAVEYFIGSCSCYTFADFTFTDIPSPS